ncbi:MAG TPA: DUF2934 domain-containing protein [Pararhizobium sp.]|uniref:DUF2934 domain-containing protein n=1 Tax=Pararhizobium sp. TaxID=1977563 RepID=UPI002CC399E5|nr:DUF2934 domain-containing protein [Pararhizobium sp.]HTO30377.1 DUF2934 domain-containing protein [Pararhizobium sp.]
MTGISEDDIRTRAYALWEADGRPDGSHDAHWLQALRQLTDESEAVSAVPVAKAIKTSKLSVMKNEVVPEPVARKRSKIA